MIRNEDAISAARALLGTPYSEIDCINLIKRVIRTAPGGVPWYTTAGTNALWASYGASAKYRDLTWRQDGIAGARAGMLAFKRHGGDVHHVGIVTELGTVIHSSSVHGKVVETAMDESWHLLAQHRYIEVAAVAAETEGTMDVLYQAVVNTMRDPLALRDSPGTDGRKLGELARGTTVDVLAEFAAGYAGPVLAIHGEQDTTGDPEWSNKIVAASTNAASRTFFIEGMDHTFNVFSGEEYKSLYIAVDATGEFFAQTLK